MLVFIGRRLLQVLPILLGVSLVVFALVHLLEDDGRFDPQAIEVLKQSFVDLGIAMSKS